MASPSIDDITALDVTGNKDLATQWPPLVRSIQYVHNQQSNALGLGGAAQTLSLSNGTAVGASSITLLLNPESGYSDTLTNISVSSYIEGQLIFVGLASQGTSPNFISLKLVVAAGGSGQLMLKDNVRYLNRIEQVVVFQLRGANWYEILVDGREYIRRVIGTGPTIMPALVDETELVIAAPFTSAANEITYYKDTAGICHMQISLNSGGSTLSNTTTSIFSTPLPTSYRPIAIGIFKFPGVLYTASVTKPVMFDVNANGNIYLDSYPAPGVSAAHVIASISYPTF